MSNNLKYWNVGYKLNRGSLFVYKSGRKNSAINGDMINIYHLINKEFNHISDTRILKQYIGTVESVLSLVTPGNIWVSAWVDVYKNNEFINDTNEREDNVLSNWYDFNKRHFDTIYSLLYFIFSIYCLIYPYNEISYKYTVLKDPSIIQLIKEYERYEKK